MNNKNELLNSLNVLITSDQLGPCNASKMKNIDTVRGVCQTLHCIKCPFYGNKHLWRHGANILDMYLGKPL